MWNTERDRGEVDHLVYLTERQLDIAREEARRKIALAQRKTHSASARVNALALRADADENRAQLRARDAVIEQYQDESGANGRMIASLRQEIIELKSQETKKKLKTFAA